MPSHSVSERLISFPIAVPPFPTVIYLWQSSTDIKVDGTFSANTGLMHIKPLFDFVKRCILTVFVSYLMKNDISLLILLLLSNYRIALSFPGRWKEFKNSI